MSSIDITNVTPFLLSIPAGGAVLYSIVRIVKKFTRLDISLVIHFFTVALSAVIAIAAYIAQYKNLPIAVLGVTGPAIYGVSQAVYTTGRLIQQSMPTITAFLMSLFAAKTAPSPTATIQDEITAAQQSLSETQPQVQPQPTLTKNGFDL